MNENYKPLISLNELIYTSCYCEENIWKFCEKILIQSGGEDLDEIYVVFISNKNRTVPIWFQKSCQDLQLPVVWDYHVIAIHKNKKLSKSFVYDLDTKLSFPVEFENYLKNALVLLENIDEKYHRLYRVIQSKYYLKNFASDRSHMINAQTGEYNSPLPDYPCIQSEISKNNIQEFIDMNISSKNNQQLHGSVVMNECEFRGFFS